MRRSISPGRRPGRKRLRAHDRSRRRSGPALRDLRRRRRRPGARALRDALCRGGARDGRDAPTTPWPSR